MTAVSAEDVARRRAEILAAVARAAEKSGRRAEEIAVMAVTKGHGPESVAHAARAGFTLFGENRVQEGSAKIAALGDRFPGLTWRLIGPLQSNKAKSALQWFAAVESLDRERLAVRLDALLGEEGGERRLPVLLEINVGDEESKSGVAPDEAPRLCEAVLACRRLDVRGVMAVPPFDPDPEKSRPFFRRLVEVRDRLAAQFGRPFPELSMGMSHDFGVAVEEGSTEVRIGTALFGPRGAA